MMHLLNRISRCFPAKLMLAVSLLLTATASAQPDGEKLFKGYCASCHQIDKDMTGPALLGSLERWSGKEELLYEWVRNPAAVKATGDPYVKELLAEWEHKSGLMTGQPLSDEEISAIFEYIETPRETAAAPTGATGSADEEASGDADPESGETIFFLSMIGLVLMIIILSMSSVRRALTGALQQQQGKEAREPVSYFQELKVWMWKNKVLTSLVLIFFLVLGTVDLWDRLMAVGVYEGYKPEQPISFNHTLHAGEMGIDCQYCHSGAADSKHAGIPAASVCMNCHVAISEGRSDNGTEDIQRLYAAVGWDSEKMDYTAEPQPISWVKVHNLPDHVYFNHSQHVTVGGVECQTCHGPIDEEYTVAEQFAPLTMGWCLDCHNSTDIDMTSSEYYEEIHSRFANHERGREFLKTYLEDGGISVKDMGGWECSKCHY